MYSCSITTCLAHLVGLEHRLGGVESQIGKRVNRDHILEDLLTLGGMNFVWKLLNSEKH